MCIGDPVGGNVPAVNCILDVNGATNIEGSVAIRGGTYITGETVTSGLIRTAGIITTTANRLGIFGVSPTIYFRHSNTGLRSAMIHNNSTLLYFLSGAYNSDITNDNWDITVNGRWPLTLNLTNNNAVFGGDVNAIFLLQIKLQRVLIFYLMMQYTLEAVMIQELEVIVAGCI